MRRPGWFGCGRKVRLLVFAALVAAGAPSAALAAALLPAESVPDPLPPMSAAGITVRLTPFVTVPHGGQYGAPQLIQPVGDGSGRLAINDTGGRIYLTTPAGGALGAPYLSLVGTAPGFANGLQGLAFAPDFASSGKFYTGSYASSGTGITPLASSTGAVNDMVVTEWIASNPAAPVFSGTSREVLRVAQPSDGHAIGMVAFNPNATPGNADYGKLYISMGDAGDNRSYLMNGQDTTNPYGKVLRIDPTPSGSAGFTVPSDNPFVGQAGAEQTIWAYGLRNPQYLSWLRGGAETMFISDIGEGHLEEVNTGVAGGNYGWSVREGTFATWRDPALGVGYTDEVFRLAPGPEAGWLFPVAQYDHSEGFAIGSGVIYQGTAVPQLTGKLIASDIVNGRLFAADVDGLLSDEDPDGTTEFRYLTTILNGIEQSLPSALGAPRADARLGTDDAGNLYVLTKANGQIFRVEAVDASVPAPAAWSVLAVALLGLAGLRRHRPAA